MACKCNMDGRESRYGWQNGSHIHKTDDRERLWMTK